MTDEHKTEDPWNQVGQEFKVLGENLAQAFRSAWESEENREQMQSVQTGLESLVVEVSRAIGTASDSPEGQKVRAEAKKAVESARAAGEEALQQVRPHLLDALRQVNAELIKYIGGQEQE